MDRSRPGVKAGSTGEGVRPALREPNDRAASRETLFEVVTPFLSSIRENSSRHRRVGDGTTFRKVW